MPRPVKHRFISRAPRVAVFVPRGVPEDRLAVVTLCLDELEAIRLADLTGDNQERAAAKMNVSRATFGRILERAHRSVADALLHGKTLEIRGGPVIAATRDKVRCRRCRRAWEVPTPVATDFRCPRCPAER